MEKPFNKKFLWGASSSAYQIEGAAFEDGKKASQQDIINQNSIFADTKVASDHYHKFKEDIKLMKELGLKAYRFSISWPRILPNGVGDSNPQGVRFYHQLIDELLEAGIEPIVTMYHYDMPWTLVEKYGGWMNRQSVDDFAYYVELLLKEYGSKIKYWITINEQNIIFRAWTKKNYIPKDLHSDEKLRYQVNHHYTMAHAMACKLVHEMCPHAKVSGVPAIEPAYPLTSSPEDNMAAARANVMRTYFFTDPYMKGEYPQEVLRYLEKNNLMFEMKPGDEKLMKEGTSDYLAVNYYRSTCAKACREDVLRIDQELNLRGIKGSQKTFETIPGLYELCQNPNLDSTDWDWPIDSMGLTYTLMDIYQRYGKPMMIAENGLGARDSISSDGRIHDSYRIEYLKHHIDAIRAAIENGVDLFSYCAWSFMDLLSTSNGYSKRYGLVYVNRDDTDLKDLARIKKDSFYWYQTVISSNGEII